MLPGTSQSKSYPSDGPVDPIGVSHSDRDNLISLDSTWWWDSVVCAWSPRPYVRVDSRKAHTFAATRRLTDGAPGEGTPFALHLADESGKFRLLALDFDAATADPDHAFMTWGWRIPFLASAIMVAVGLYVRLKLTETPVFAKAVADGKKVKAPLAEVVKTSWRPLIAGTFIMVATYTLFYIVTTWVISYGTGKVTDESGVKLSISYVDFLQLQLVAVDALAFDQPPVGGRPGHRDVEPGGAHPTAPNAHRVERVDAR